MKYKAIVFDVGDTLIAYSPAWAQIYGDRIRSLRIDVTEETARKISEAVYWAHGEQTRQEQEGIPRVASEVLTKILDAAALSCVLYNKEMEDTYLRKMSRLAVPKQEVSVISGVFETLNILKAKYRLAIVSNYSQWLLTYLKESGLYNYFESVIISGIVGIEKPDVRIMELVLSELGLPAESCLYVGDHPLDVLCAKKAGMDCAWIARADATLHRSIPYEEDYRIGSIADLIDIV